MAPYSLFCKINQFMSNMQPVQPVKNVSSPVPEGIPTPDVFKFLVENIQEYAIFMLSPSGQVMSWNSGAEKFKGYKAAEIIGKHFSFFYTPSDIKNGRPQKLLEIAAAEGKAVEEGWRVRKDGTHFWALVVITCLRDSSGKIIGFAKVTRDMTDRRSWEADLERKIELRTMELQRTNYELEQFAYVASHDLQEPLRMVRMYSDLILLKLKNSADEDLRKYLDYVIQGATRAQTLTHELLEYSRLSKQQINFLTVDLEKVLKECLYHLKISIAEKNAVITQDPLPSIRGDEFLLSQLFENLLSNAIKYTKGRPHIHISASQIPDHHYAFSITDDGIGIAPEFHSTIFEVFKRLHSREEYPGSGIGLAICKKIVERHGGRIWVESQKGQGASFKFVLPA